MTQKTVLLQTTKVRVMNPSYRRQETCNILLETGIQRSYITSNIARKLKLDVVTKEHLKILEYKGE